MFCPSCGSPDQSIKESRLIRNGAARRRRFVCQSCDHKWTGFFDAESDQTIEQPRRTRPRADNRRQQFHKLTEEMVVEILTSDLTDARMAEIAGVSRQCVGFIRNGDTFKLVRPDLPRRQRGTRLSSGDVQDILQRGAEGEPVADIAFDYELPEARIRQVIHRGSRAAV